VGIFFRLMLGLTMAAAAWMNSARSEDSAVYLVSYVDVLPNAATSAAALLEHYRDASRKESGNMRFDVLQEIGRPNRFAVVEIWNDKAASEAHAKAASASEFVEKLKAIENAPPDVRILGGLNAAPLKAANASAVYAVTHVDVIPPSKDDCIALLAAMSTDTRNEPGNIGYDVLQQANRSNHFTVFEAWASKEALDAHAMTEHTRAFRHKLSPMEGALYDERFYKALS